MGRDLILMLLLIVTIGGYVVLQNHRVTSARSDAASARTEAQRLAGELGEAKLKERVVVRYVDRVQVVRERGETITKEIPVYVTAKADARCDVPAGFVSVHDAAAQNVPLGEPAGDPDAPAAGITLSGVARTVAGNYAACHAIREQLIGLQDYVSGLQALERP
jgi:hypothetical protein